VFRLTIFTDNAAFEGDLCGEELARILFELATRVTPAGSLTKDEWTLRDVNGNVVGRATLN
jgi:hypothetical protein